MPDGFAGSGIDSGESAAGLTEEDDAARGGEGARTAASARERIIPDLFARVNIDGANEALAAGLAADSAAEETLADFDGAESFLKTPH